MTQFEIVSAKLQMQNVVVITNGFVLASSA